MHCASASTHEPYTNLLMDLGLKPLRTVGLFCLFVGLLKEKKRIPRKHEQAGPKTLAVRSRSCGARSACSCRFSNPSARWTSWRPIESHPRASLLDALAKLFCRVGKAHTNALASLSLAKQVPCQAIQQSCEAPYREQAEVMRAMGLVLAPRRDVRKSTGVRTMIRPTPPPQYSSAWRLPESNVMN